MLVLELQIHFILHCSMKLKSLSYLTQRKKLSVAKQIPSAINFFWAYMLPIQFHTVYTHLHANL